MDKRDTISEGLLCILVPFTALLGAIGIGAPIAFFLPKLLGAAWIIACACIGPVTLFRLDRHLYGPRS